MLPDDACDGVWELTDFCLRENYALRSLLKYLLESRDTPEVKQVRLRGWKNEVSTSLGDPLTSSRAESILSTIRSLPPEEQKQALQDLLSAMAAFYLG